MFRTLLPELMSKRSLQELAVRLGSSVVNEDIRLRLLAGLAAARGRIDTADIIRSVAGARETGIRMFDVSAGVTEAYLTKIASRYGANILEARDRNDPLIRKIGNELADGLRRFAARQGVFIQFREDYVMPKVPDIAAILRDLADNNGDITPIVNEFVKAGWKEDSAREWVDMFVRQGVYKLAQVRDYRHLLRGHEAIRTDIEKGFMPPAFFLRPREDLAPLPTKYQLPFAQAWKAYADLLGDYVHIRNIEAELYSKVNNVPRAQAFKELYELDRSIWAEEGRIPKLGEHLYSYLRALDEKLQDPLFSEFVESTIYTLKRALGDYPRTATEDFTRGIVPLLSGIYSGFVQISQFMNEVALRGFSNFFRGLAKMTLTGAPGMSAEEYAIGIARLTTIMGQSRSFVIEDILGRVDLEPEVLLQLQRLFPNMMLGTDIAGGMLKGFSRKLMRAVGMELMEKTLRTTSTATFIEFLEQGLKNQDRGFKAWKAWMNLDDAQVKRMLDWAKKIVTSPEINFEHVADPEAAKLFSYAYKYTQFLYTPMDFPLAMSKHPLLDTIFHFKKFAYLQSTRYMAEVIGRASKGDLEPLIKTLAAVSPVMLTVDYLRGILSGTGFRIYQVPVEGHLIVRAEPVHYDERGVLNPQARTGLIRRLNAISPLLSAYVQALFESGALGVAGDLVHAVASGSMKDKMFAMTPVAVSHAFRISGAIADALGDLAKGEIWESIKRLGELLLRDAAPPLILAKASKYPSLQALVTGRLGPIGGILLGIPRMFAQSIMELKDEQEILRKARSDTIDAFLQGDPAWVDLNAYLIMRFGPDAAITSQDVLRKWRSRFVADLGLTQREISFRRKFKDDAEAEAIQNLIEEESEKKLEEIKRLIRYTR